MRLEEAEIPEFVARARHPWLTPLLLGAFVFALSALAIRSAVARQEPILDSMELQPYLTAAALAYAWGSARDAEALEREVLSLAERAGREDHGARSSRDPDFGTLRRMDADMAKLRLAELRHAPRSDFEHLCARATIRCTPHTLEGLLTLLKKQRHVDD